jgi:hypothetical protein
MLRRGHIFAYKIQDHEWNELKRFYWFKLSKKIKTCPISIKTLNKIGYIHLPVRSGGIYSVKQNKKSVIIGSSRVIRLLKIILSQRMRKWKVLNADWKQPNLHHEKWEAKQKKLIKGNKLVLVF